MRCHHGFWSWLRRHLPGGRRIESEQEASEAQRERVRRAQALVAERQAGVNARVSAADEQLSYLRDRLRVLDHEQRRQRNEGP
jgi:hypothetical protein